jgi:hypothetical protein
MAELQQVFKTGGVPTVTFVRPLEYPKIILNLKTAGRGLVIEGPSGIGKTTAIRKAIAELELTNKVVRLSARKREDVEYISIIPETRNFGIILIDDFHILADQIKASIADIVKVLADEEVEQSKLIVVGINEAGNSLIKFAPDLVNRLDIIRFENSSDDKVAELVQKGENELNIRINVKDDIVKEANGGFYIAQMLCSEICEREGILKTSENMIETDTSFESIKYAIWKRLSANFYDICKKFALGSRYRPEGRAPYLHMLTWLANSGDWVLNLGDAMRTHQEMRMSVGQVVEKNYLSDLFERNNELMSVLHFDGRSLVVEDPQFIFYIRNMPWAKFARDLGFKNVGFENRYDFALSFAGSQRPIAEKIFEGLCDEEFAVFYDANEQSRIVGNNLEEYLEPIYQSKARFIICILSNDYPQKIWTVFEAGNFEQRIGAGEVIPVVVDATTIDAFSSLSKTSYLRLDSKGDIGTQVGVIVDILRKKLSEL